MLQPSMRKTNELLTYVIWIGLMNVILLTVGVGLLLHWESRFTKFERELNNAQKQYDKAMRDLANAWK